MSPEPAVIRKGPGIEVSRGTDLKVAPHHDVGDVSPSAVPRTSVLFRTLFEGWHIVAVAIVLAAATSIGISYALPFSYTATTTLFPALRDGAGASTSAMQRLFGLTSGQTLSTDEAIATLESTKFLSAFITNHDYMPIIMSSDWDPATKTWKDDSEPPTLMRAVDEFRRSIIVTRTPLSLSMIVTYSNSDPKVASDTLNMLITDLNETMRRDAVERSERIIAHYQKTLQTAATIPADVRAHVVALMSDEMKTLAGAQSTESYAVRVTDPAYAPELRSFPRRSVITVIGTLLGLFIGLLVVFGRHFIRSVREDLRQDRMRRAGAEAL